MLRQFVRDVIVPTSLTLGGHSNRKKLMRFSQIDRITSLEKGKSITAVKGLSMSEEYLKDHFPRFPVMPGVLMLEAVYQAAMFLVRYSDDFQYGMVRLVEARNLKFQDFVQPGDQLTISAKYHSEEGDRITLRVEGRIGEKRGFSGRLILERFNTADDGLGAEATDGHLKRKFAEFFGLLQNQIPEDA